MDGNEVTATIVNVKLKLNIPPTTFNFFFFFVKSVVEFLLHQN